MPQSVDQAPAANAPANGASPSGTAAAAAPRTIREQIEAAGTLIKAVMVLLAALPPLAVITGLVDIPPTLEQIVKMVTVPISVVTVLGIYVTAGSIARMSSPRAFIIFGTCALIGTILTIAYFVFTHPRIVSIGDERLVIPIQPSVAIVEMVEPYDYNYGEALRNSPDKDQLRQALEREQGPAVVAMIVLMVCAQIFFVAGMVGLLAKATLQSQKAEPQGVGGQQSPADPADSA